MKPTAQSQLRTNILRFLTEGLTGHSRLFLWLSAIVLAVTLFTTGWSSNGPILIGNGFSRLALPDTLANLDQLAEGGHHTDLGAAQAIMPAFLQPPDQPWDLWAPTLSIVLLCGWLSQIPSNNWTRLALRLIFLGLTLRYLLWRSLATLSFDWNAVAIFGMVIYLLELVGLTNFVLTGLQSIWSSTQKRQSEADRHAETIRRGQYQPSVDVFVPTYNEPELVVRRTVVGCQAMSYPNKTVYILDDTRRPHIKALAEELGCQYITRPNNDHAKAGNLNSALPKTYGELITILDADFVPFKEFLTRTVGFFQDETVAMVQTPQSFYNPDHHVRNLGVSHLQPNDLAEFFKFDQSCRDAANSVVCCGTSYVARRKALQEVGGYYTRCVSEDSPTFARIMTLGYRMVYLNEILSMGESTRTYTDFIKQRMRWLQGNYQIFCCGRGIPIWSTLGFIQKSYFVTFFLGCFQPILRAVFMTMPLICLALGISPYQTTPDGVIFYLLPYLFLIMGSRAWLSEYHSSFLWSEVYQTILCFPSVSCLISTIRKPFGKPFVVTRKGVKEEGKRYNFMHTWPLLLLIAGTFIMLSLHLVGFHWGVWQTVTDPGFLMIAFWLVYNASIAAIAVLAAIDQPERRSMDRFPLQTDCQIQTVLQAPRDTPEGSLARNIVQMGRTLNLAEEGVQLLVQGTQAIPLETEVAIAFPAHGFSIKGQVIRSDTRPTRRGAKDLLHNRLTVRFVEVSTAQNRRLVEVLYTDMTDWKRSKQPSSLDICLALFQSLLAFRPLRRAYHS